MSDAPSNVAGNPAGISAEDWDYIARKYQRKCEESGTTGEPVDLDTRVRISKFKGIEIARLIQSTRTHKTLEVGLAYGFSTAWIMAALNANGGGTHTAIDPAQKRLWHDIGRRCGKDLSREAQFVFAEEMSIHALTAAIRKGEQYGFVFIDGKHRFDDVLVDFYLADMITPIGGIIALDDLWLPSIQTVVDFIKRNRSFEWVDQPCPDLGVFRKTAADNRHWDHYIEFSTRPAPPPLSNRTNGAKD